MQIPASVRGLLWEYRIEGPLEDHWEDSIISRVMQLGGWSEMQWLLQTFGRPRLHEYLEGHGRRVLAPRELRYWAFVCGVPGNEQDAWVAEARRREKAWRG